MKLILPKNSEAIVFEKVFANSILKQSLLYHAKVAGSTCFTLYSPESFITKIKKELSGDSELSGLSITIEAIEMMDSHVDEAIPVNQVYDVYGNSWNISNTSDLKLLRKNLKASIREHCQTPVAKYINKRISLPISHVLAKWHVRPNAVTFVGLLLSLIGGILLLSPHHFILAFALFQLNSILDGTDGEIAKLNFTFSSFGKKFDVFGDYLTSFLIIVFESIGYLIHSTSIFEIWVSYSNLALIFMIGLIWILAQKLKLTPKNFEEVEGLCHQKLKEPKTFYDKLNKIFLMFSQRDFYIFTLFVLSFFRRPEMIHVFILIICVSWMILTLYTLRLLLKSGGARPSTMS